MMLGLSAAIAHTDTETAASSGNKTMVHKCLTMSMVD